MVATFGAKPARGARGVRVVQRALPQWQLGRAPVRLRARARGCARARTGGLTCGVPCYALSQEPPPPDDFAQNVAFVINVLMLLNLLLVQPLQESITQGVAETQALIRDGQAETQALIREQRAETREQFARMQAILEPLEEARRARAVAEDAEFQAWRSLVSKR